MFRRPRPATAAAGFLPASPARSGGEAVAPSVRILHAAHFRCSVPFCSIPPARRDPAWCVRATLRMRRPCPVPSCHELPEVKPVKKILFLFNERSVMSTAIDRNRNRWPPSRLLPRLAGSGAGAMAVFSNCIPAPPEWFTGRPAAVKRHPGPGAAALQAFGPPSPGGRPPPVPPPTAMPAGRVPAACRISHSAA